MKGVTARVQHEDAVAARSGQRERLEADRARLRAVDPRPRAAARHVGTSLRSRGPRELTRPTTRASTSVRTTTMGLIRSEIRVGLSPRAGPVAAAAGSEARLPRRVHPALGSSEALAARPSATAQQCDGAGRRGRGRNVFSRFMDKISYVARLCFFPRSGCAPGKNNNNGGLNNGLRSSDKFAPFRTESELGATGEWGDVYSGIRAFSTPAGRADSSRRARWSQRTTAGARARVTRRPADGGPLPPRVRREEETESGARDARCLRLRGASLRGGGRPPVLAPPRLWPRR